MVEEKDGVRDLPHGPAVAVEVASFQARGLGPSPEIKLQRHRDFRQRIPEVTVTVAISPKESGRSGHRSDVNLNVAGDGSFYHLGFRGHAGVVDLQDPEDASRQACLLGTLVIGQDLDFLAAG